MPPPRDLCSQVECTKDCGAGWKSWYHGWSDGKKSWCCVRIPSSVLPRTAFHVLVRLVRLALGNASMGSVSHVQGVVALASLVLILLS